MHDFFYCLQTVFGLRDNKRQKTCVGHFYFTMKVNQDILKGADSIKALVSVKSYEFPSVMPLKSYAVLAW